MIELLIGVALLGGVALGVAHLSKQINSTQSSADSAMDILMLKQEMMSLMAVERFCRLSLAGPDPVTSPVTFKKQDIDDAATEGLPVELWLSDMSGTARTKKRFSGSDADYNKVGRNEIASLKLVMNNPTVPAGPNYPAGSGNDAGIVRLVLKKKNGNTFRDIVEEFPVMVSFTTAADGTSTLLSCSSVTSGTSTTGQVLVVHSQNSTIPTCPAGWGLERSGHSLAMVTGNNGYNGGQDLGGQGSCLREHASGLPFLECTAGMVCNRRTPDDFVLWLTNTGASPPTSLAAFDANNISRCAVCVSN